MRSAGWIFVDLFLNIMTPLIMVISFRQRAASFAARDRLIAGESRYQALGRPTRPSIFVDRRRVQVVVGQTFRPRRASATSRSTTSRGDGRRSARHCRRNGAQLATFTGHNLKDVEAILDAHYLAETFSSLKPRC